MDTQQHRPTRHPQPRRPRRQEGFTLAELLIVMGLLTLLIAALTPALMEMMSAGGIADTTARVEKLKSMIENYARKNGDYPPSRFAKAKKNVKVKNNGVNEGIECLILHLHLKSLGRSATLEDNPDWLQNTDEDDGGFLIPLLDTSKLNEVVDGWGNPIVYFREDSYGQRQAVLMGADSEGMQEEVAALKDATTNKYLNPRKFQLISAGPDLTYGTEDDITYPAKKPVD